MNSHNSSNCILVYATLKVSDVPKIWRRPCISSILALRRITLTLSTCLGYAVKRVSDDISLSLTLVNGIEKQPISAQRTQLKSLGALPLKSGLFWQKISLFVISI